MAEPHDSKRNRCYGRTTCHPLGCHGRPLEWHHQTFGILKGSFVPGGGGAATRRRRRRPENVDGVLPERVSTTIRRARSWVDARTTGAAAPSRCARSQFATPSWTTGSPGTRPGNRNSGSGVDWSLPMRCQCARNFAVTTSQPVHRTSQPALLSLGIQIVATFAESAALRYERQS